MQFLRIDTVASLLETLCQGQSQTFYRQSSNGVKKKGPGTKKREGHFLNFILQWQ